MATDQFAPTEQVVGLGNYGQTLTVITCPSLQDETGGDDDGEAEKDLLRHAGRLVFIGEKWRRQLID